MSDRRQQSAATGSGPGPAADGDARCSLCLGDLPNPPSGLDVVANATRTTLRLPLCPACMGAAAEPLRALCGLTDGTHRLKTGLKARIKVALPRDAQDDGEPGGTLYDLHLHDYMVKCLPVRDHAPRFTATITMERSGAVVCVGSISWAVVKTGAGPSTAVVLSAAIHLDEPRCANAAVRTFLEEILDPALGKLGINKFLAHVDYGDGKLWKEKLGFRQATESTQRAWESEEFMFDSTSCVFVKGVSGASHAREAKRRRTI